jgi:hypothetical protein
MYLKGYSCQTMGERQRRSLKHDLENMWHQFKSIVSDPTLERFDSLVLARQPGGEAQETADPSLRFGMTTKARRAALKGGATKTKAQRRFLAGPKNIHPATR